MKTQHLNAATRTKVGRAVKQLRRDGVLPATIYGKGVKSISIQLKRTDFVSMLEAAGETRVIEIQLQDSSHSVLIHTVQRHPVSEEILHVEFLQVNLKEKIQTTVPIVLTGESPAVVNKEGMLLELSLTVDVEALPTDLPEHLEADVTMLVAIGDEITAENLKLPSSVKLISEPSHVVARIAELVKQEKEPEVVAEEKTEEGEGGKEGAQKVDDETDKKEESEGEKESQPKKDSGTDKKDQEEEK